MKKVRKIKILVSTREILVTRSEANESFAGSTNFPVCPICSSHLAGPLPVSVERLNVETIDDSMTAENYKKTDE